MTEDFKKEKWHIGKEVPVAVVFALAVQAVGVVWGAATVIAELKKLSEQVAELKLDRYTKYDADRDKVIVLQKIEYVESRLDEHLRRAVR